MKLLAEESSGRRSQSRTRPVSLGQLLSLSQFHSPDIHTASYLLSPRLGLGADLSHFWRARRRYATLTLVAALQIGWPSPARNRR